MDAINNRVGHLLVATYWNENEAHYNISNVISVVCYLPLDKSQFFIIMIRMMYHMNYNDSFIVSFLRVVYIGGKDGF